MKILTGFIFGTSILSQFAQPMLLDESFAPMIVREGGGVRALDVESNGRIVVGGSFDITGGLPRKGLARLNADGSGDATFRAPGLSNVFAMTRLNNGRIIVGGRFDFVGRTPKAGLARFEADGELDSSFDAQLSPGTVVSSIATQADGKLVIAGTRRNVNGVSRPWIARLQPDGIADATFDTGTSADSFINAIALATDGKVIVAGGFKTFNGVQRPHIVRLNMDGSIDGSFGIGGSPSSEISAMARAPDGRLFIGGSFTKIGNDARQYVARLNENGTLDPTFAATNLDSPVFRLIPQGDKVVVTTSGSSRLVRLNGDGTRDRGFSPSIVGAFVYAISNLPNGQLLVASDFSQAVGPATNTLVRLKEDSRQDASFNATFGYVGEVLSVAIGKDRKITFLGTFTHVDGVPRAGFARLLEDGSLDTAFNPMSAFHGSAFCLREDRSYYVFRGPAVVNLLPDGTPAALINLAGYRLFQQLVIQEQPDGKIVVAGWKYHNSQTTPIQRFWPSGNEDTNFTPVFEPFQLQLIAALRFEADGKLLIAGQFSQIDATPRKNVARLNENGTVDASFDPGAGPNWQVRAAARHADGSYIIGGDFDQYGAVFCGRIARLFPGGTFDPSFSPGFGFDDAVYDVALQQDGKVVVGGNFTSYGGSLVKRRIMRLDRNGQPDPEFQLGDGADGRVNDIELASNGDFVIAGAFTEVDGREHFALARFVRLPQITIHREANGCRMIRVRAPEGRDVVIEMSLNLSQWTPVSTNTAPEGVVQYSHCESSAETRFFRAILRD